MVAKSFQGMTLLCEPYESNKKMYVKIRNEKTGTERVVRWYTESEYIKMYPEEKDKIVVTTKANPQKEVLGFTKIVLEVPVVEEEKRYCLTSSGVLIVKSLYRDFVITAFMCNVDQCYRLYRMAGKAQVSPKVYKKITKNIERHSELFYI